MVRYLAWAGIYYFAAHGEHDDKGPITQPEGNGWIVKRLLAKLARYVRTELTGRRNSQAMEETKRPHAGYRVYLR